MAEEKSYIGNNEIVDSISGDELVPILKGNTEGGSVYNAEKLYGRASEIGGSSGDWTPIVSNETNLSAGFSNCFYTRIGNYVWVNGSFNIVLDGGQTNGGFNITAPIEPSVNWSSFLDVNIVLHRTNSIFTAECKLQSDDSGSKLLSGGFSDTTAGATIRGTFSGGYKLI